MPYLETGLDNIDDLDDEAYERRRVLQLCDQMAMHLYGFALALKYARCNKAFRRFRTALATADAFDTPDSRWVIYPETYRIIREEFAALPQVLGRDKRRNPDRRARVMNYAFSIRQLWYYFRTPSVGINLMDFRYLDRKAQTLISELATIGRPPPP